MLLNIDSISNAMFYSVLPVLIPEKIQIDNVDIMNAFCKAMFLLSYSFITSRISHVLFFRNVCLKIANFHNLSKNRQIHVINRCQLMVFDAFIL